jgi:hypothetical protein
MCEYFSGILKKDGTVLWLKDCSKGDPQSHETIIHVHGLKDVKLVDRDWVRFEITPKDASKLNTIKRSELTHGMWKFRWDEQGTAPWLADKSAKHIKKCWEALEESWKTQLLFTDEVIETLKDYDYIHAMYGSAQIGKMYGSAQIRYMYGSAQVGEMYGSAQVGEMYGSAQVGKMDGSAQIRYMYGSAQIRYMYGSAQIRYMDGSAQVGEMYGSAQIRYMYGSAQIRDMYGSAQVGEMYGSAQVGKMYGSAQVGELKGLAVARKNGEIYAAIDAVVQKLGKVEA